MAEVHHVLSRGVDKRKIFMDDKDRFRFIHDLFEFNDQAPAENVLYHLRRPSIDVGHRYDADVRRRNINRPPRKILVNLYAFCLMPNHYHLLLSPFVENGISLFMKKLNGGYAKYFNQKYKRTGTLFEGRFKSVLTENHAHFIHLPYYIHLNPLDLIAPEWRKRKTEDYKKAIEFLDSYRWSSHLDYTGQSNFPSVTQRDFLLEIIGGEEQYKKLIGNWLADCKEARIRDITLE